MPREKTLAAVIELASGMGAYHGAEGFKTMSHGKAVFRQARFNVVDLFRPPFGKAFDFLLNIQLR